MSCVALCALRLRGSVSHPVTNPRTGGELCCRVGESSSYCVSLRFSVCTCEFRDVIVSGAASVRVLRACAAPLVRSLLALFSRAGVGTRRVARVCV